MKYWRIDYYRTRNWIHAKYIKDECAQGAIKKARVKNIVDVQEISEEEYKAGLAQRKAAAQVRTVRLAKLELREYLNGCFIEELEEKEKEKEEY